MLVDVIAFACQLKSRPFIPFRAALGIGGIGVRDGSSHRCTVRTPGGILFHNQFSKIL